MEVAECTKILSSRIQKLEPETCNKIIGYLLLNHEQQDIIEYAHGPDNRIHELITEAKAFFASSPKPGMTKPAIPPPLQPLYNQPMPYRPFLHTISRAVSSPSSFRVPAPYWDSHLASDQRPATHDFDLPLPYNNFSGGLHNQGELLRLEEQLQSLNLRAPNYSTNCYNPEVTLGGGSGSMVGPRSPPGMPEFLSSRACHYHFYKGFCKNGSNCKYSHGPSLPEDGTNINELVNDDHIFAPGSLEKLEMEITELLRARRGVPVSIAALPMMYHEMYGRTLQAEGYLTESQRHGKTGISLTKLLARLNNNIRLIDRPHGQHSVVLAEDAPKYVEYRNERGDLGVVCGSSNQIYLTFPAESAFTEEDVANYFKQYGPIRDVRIPKQEKRMFGFVSFLYSETVKIILGMGHPHYICGARVLVKPYKEKTRQNDKKFLEKLELPMYYPKFFEMDPDHYSFPRVCGSPRLLENQLIQDQNQALELERRRLFERWLTSKPPSPILNHGPRMNDLNHSEDITSLQDLKTSSGEDEKNTHTSNSSSDQDSSHIELPESPFGFPR